MNIPIKIFLRKDFQKKDGSYPVYLRLTLRRRLKVYSLNISTLLKSWDDKNQKVRKTDMEYHKKNMLIEYYLNKAKKIIFDYTVKNQLLTIYEFDRCFKYQFYEGNSFYDFIENELKTLKDKFSKDTI